MPSLSASQLAMLKKLLSPTGVAAEFEVDTLRIGARKLEDR